jgi:hypothetical protein
MRIFAGRKLGPIFVGGSVGPFHPSKVFLTHGSGGYQARPWFTLFGFAFLAVMIWLVIVSQ